MREVVLSTEAADRSPTQTLRQLSSQGHVLSRHSSEGRQLSSEGHQLSSVGHSSGESSTQGLLASATRVARSVEVPPSSFPFTDEWSHRQPMAVPDISIPSPDPIPRPPSSPSSIYSNRASLLNPPTTVPTITVRPISPPQPLIWPPPPVRLPSFGGSTSELPNLLHTTRPRLLPTDSYVSFRDEADYSRPIVSTGSGRLHVEGSDDEDDIDNSGRSDVPRAL